MCYSKYDNITAIVLSLYSAAEVLQVCMQSELQYESYDIRKVLQARCRVLLDSRSAAAEPAVAVEK